MSINVRYSQYSVSILFYIFFCEKTFFWNLFLMIFNSEMKKKMQFKIDANYLIFSILRYILYSWNSQLACLSGANGCYVRHISAGAPKRSHFASSRRQNSSSNHINEISTTTNGTNGTAKKRVSLTCCGHFIVWFFYDFFFLFCVQQRRRKGNKLKFHRPKIHAPHRLPQIMRRIIQQQKLLG